MSDGERRSKRREIRLLQSESVWLQKALFALRKAEAAREKVADARGEEMGDYTLPLEDGEISVERVEEALEQRIETQLQTVRSMRRSLQ